MNTLSDIRGTNENSFSNLPIFSGIPMMTHKPTMKHKSQPILYTPPTHLPTTYAKCNIHHRSERTNPVCEKEIQNIEYIVCQDQSEHINQHSWNEFHSPE